VDGDASSENDEADQENSIDPLVAAASPWFLLMINERFW
jgi:hypothetical protein